MANDPEKPDGGEAPPEGGDVVSLDEARKRAEEKQASAQPPNPVMQGIMAQIVGELAKLAGPDGKVELGGGDDASRAKTAAVLRGIGAGLGAALADAFAKWAEKVTVTAEPGDPNATPPAPDSPTATTPTTGTTATTTTPTTPTTPTPPAGDDPKKSN
jgi:hypothetical protein